MVGAAAPLRIFVLDPFRGSRRAVTSALRQTPDLALCGAAETSRRAWQDIERAKPDVVVAEIFCQQALHFIRALHQRYPRLPILVFSFLDEYRHAPEVLEAGADGFVAKTSDQAPLVEGIRTAAKGGLVLSPRVRAQFLAKCLPRRSSWPATARSLSRHRNGCQK